MTLSGKHSVLDAQLPEKRHGRPVGVAHGQSVHYVPLGLGDYQLPIDRPAALRTTVFTRVEPLRRRPTGPVPQGLAHEHQPGRPRARARLTPGHPSPAAPGDRPNTRPTPLRESERVGQQKERVSKPSISYAGPSIRNATTVGDQRMGAHEPSSLRHHQ